LPALSALLDVSRYVGPVLLGESTAADIEACDAVAANTSWTSAARHSLAEQLRAAASRVSLTAESKVRLREAESLLGVQIIDTSSDSMRPGSDIDSVLVPGARVCFTGVAQSATGKVFSREEMTEIATAAGLIPVKSVTKTRCEALITAEVGSQSGKARKAQEFGKPVFSAEEFLIWIEAKQSLAR